MHTPSDTRPQSSKPIHMGIICPPALGHLNPLMALGQELQQRGHRVTVFQVQDFETKVRNLGFEYGAIAHIDYPLGAIARSSDTLRELREPWATLYWFAEQQRLAEILCREVPHAIQALDIHGLIVDECSPAGATIAEYLGLPFTSVSNGLMLHREGYVPPVFTHWSYQKTPWAWTRNQLTHQISNALSLKFTQVLRRYRQRWALPPLPIENLLYARSGLAQLSQIPAGFDFPRLALPQHVHYVGPLHQPTSRPIPFPFQRLTGKPLVYASLGSLMRKREVFQCIAAACEDLEVQLVLTHGGGLSDAEAADLPGSPLVVAYAPQLELLARASLTITHAGLNTVMDSLSYGVPLVAIPIAFEQPGIAARIQWTGAGEVLPVAQLTVSTLRAAIQKVLSHPGYAQNALRLKAAIDQSGGVRQAATVVERAFYTQQPVCRPLPMEARDGRSPLSSSLL